MTNSKMPPYAPYTVKGHMAHSGFKFTIKGCYPVDDVWYRPVVADYSGNTKTYRQPEEDDIDIDNFRNEFKKYIKRGLTVGEAIKKFNDDNFFLINGFEVYRSLCGTIELKYVRYVGPITTDQEIENIRKDAKLKNLYEKKKKCEKQMSNLTNKMIEINYEIDKVEASK